MRPAFPPPRRDWLTARRTATPDKDDDGIDEISDMSGRTQPRRASMYRASSFIQPLPKQRSSAPHRLARDTESYYLSERFPLAAVRRSYVDDEHVPWARPSPGYAPPSSGFELTEGRRAGLSLNPDMGLNEQQVLAAGLNPGGRTGLTGGWDASTVAGANYAVDPIITRFQPGSGQRRLQLLAMLHKDGKEWAVPGARLRGLPGGGWERDIDAMERGLHEKGADIVNLDKGGEPVFCGYVDDTRNTDDAWIETTVRHYHLDDLGKGEINSSGVRWVDISPEVPIYQPHCAWVYHVADEMLKVPQIERQMRGLSLKFVFRPVPALWSDPETLIDPKALRLIGTTSNHISGSDASRTVVNTAEIFSVYAIDLRLSSLQLCDGVRALLSTSATHESGEQWVRCRCARFAPITVGLELRARFNIPQHATHQAFVYGVLDASRFEAVGGQFEDPFEGLMVSGGFVYANCDGSRAKVLRVTCVSLPTDDLYSKHHTVEFTGPCRMITPAREVHRVREQWRDVTLSFLLGVGAKSFLWLNPGEEAGEHPIKFGAFAYSSSPRGQGEAVYFYLKVADDEAMRLAKAASALDEEETAYLRSVGVEAPVEVFTRHSGNVDAKRRAAQDAADRNWFALHDAVTMGDAALVDLLVRDERLLPEEQDRGLNMPASGSALTPLQVAATHGHSAIVRVLLRRASPTIQADNGATAIDLALCVDDEVSAEQLLGKLDSAIAILPALFRVSAGEALCYVAEISRRATSAAAMQKGTHSAEAGDLLAAAERAQNLGAVLFKHLSILQRVDLLESEGSRARTVPHESGQAGMVGRPRHFIARAVGEQCKILLSDATVQSAIERRWYGELSNSVVSGYVVTPNGIQQRVHRPLSRALLFALAVGVNLLLLPFVALVPSLRSVLLRSLDLGFRQASTLPPHSVGFKRKWDPSAQLYIDSLYLLDVPILKFWLERLSLLLLTCVLAVIPRPGLSSDVMNDAFAEPVTEGALWPVLPLALWVFAHLIKEVGEASQDKLDYAEILSLSAVLVGLVANTSTIDIFPFAVIMLSLTQWLRLLSALSVRFCAMANMLVTMLGDTAEFLTLLLGVILAFAIGFRSLAGEAQAEDAECQELLVLDRAPSMAKKLFMVVLDSGENSIACLLESGPRGKEAAAMMLLYLVLTSVLLLNMLIAVLGNSFAESWGCKKEEASFEMAKRMAEFGDDAWPPPPFNLLRHPSVCGATVLPLLSPAALLERLIKACALLLCIFKVAANASRDACSWLAWLAVMLGKICREMLRCTCAQPESRYKTVDDAADGCHDHDPNRDLNPSDPNRDLKPSDPNRDLNPSDESEYVGWAEDNTIQQLQYEEKLLLRNDERAEARSVVKEIEMLRLTKAAAEARDLEVQAPPQPKKASTAGLTPPSDGTDAATSSPLFQLRLPKTKGPRMKAEAATPRGGSLPVKATPRSRGSVSGDL